MTSTLRSLVRGTIAPIAASLAIASSSFADTALLEIELAKKSVEASTAEMFTLTVKGEPGHVAILILGARRGSTPLPGVGTVEIGLAPPPFVMVVGKIPPSGKRTLSAELDCENPLMTDGPAFIQVVTFDLVARAFDQISNLVVFQVLSGDCGVCAQEAEGDLFAQHPAGHLLWLPGIGTDFVFTGGGQYTERENGTARLMGVVRSKSQPDHAFAVDILYSDRIDPLDANHPPAMSPKLELKSNAYFANGGPIDPSNWHYFETTEGVLIGLDDYEGAVIAVDGHMAAFQVGLGANGKSSHPGGAGWIEWTVLDQPDSKWKSLQEFGHGDINVDLCGMCIECVEEAGDHALTLPAFGDDFLFVSGGTLEERLDGTALLTGIIQNDNDPLNRWQVDIVFNDRILPLSPSYPPVGSPKKELSSTKYIENGGMVDTDTWHYYLTTNGRLVGLDHNAGLELDVTRKGPPFQVGVGANGKNTEYGGSGWLMIEEVHSHAGSMGDINIDIAACE